MKLQIVITASQDESSVIMWTNPSEMRWNQAAQCWASTGSTYQAPHAYHLRRDQFDNNRIIHGLLLPKHRSMDALRVGFESTEAVPLEPVSYLKPHDKAGEI